jgi:hypothetical protein
MKCWLVPAFLASLLPLLSAQRHARDIQKVMLGKGQGMCLDGSPSGYYLQLAVENPNWVVFLEAGEWCMTQAECEKMSKTEFGSSTSWDKIGHEDFGGVLSANDFENPVRELRPCTLPALWRTCISLPHHETHVCPRPITIHGPKSGFHDAYFFLTIELLNDKVIMLSMGHVPGCYLCTGSAR